MKANLKLCLAVGWLAFLIQGSAAGAGAPAFRYFKDNYDLLQKKACTLQSKGTLADFHADDAALLNLVSAKTMVLDNFYNMAASYGKEDVPGAATVLKNEARLNWDIKKFKKATALEALYCAEAGIKFLLDKDKESSDPNIPQLLPGYEGAILGLVAKAEAAFTAGNYSKMRKLFFHALWIAYPGTSKVPYRDPKG